jgi:hypothetical protein
MEQFAAMNLSSGHYGPWLPKYRALMKGRGEGRVLGRIEGASLLGMVFADGAEA